MDLYSLSASYRQVLFLEMVADAIVRVEAEAEANPRRRRSVCVSRARSTGAEAMARCHGRPGALP